MLRTGGCSFSHRVPGMGLGGSLPKKMGEDSEYRNPTFYDLSQTIMVMPNVETLHSTTQVLWAPWAFEGNQAFGMIMAECDLTVRVICIT